MEPTLADFLKGKIAVDVHEDHVLFVIKGFAEFADGGHNHDTAVFIESMQSGEIRPELLSTLRDLDSYRIFTTEAAAKAFAEKEKSD